MTLPSVETTPIPGMLVFRLDVRGDARGWFKENWQREKMIALGLPDLAPVQNNISFNTEVGVTRGLHAEPWDKFVALATGRIFGAWVDLREGESFGRTFHLEMDEHTAVYVPRGVANGYQTLAENTAYTYLVNAHWSPDAQYTFVNLADETVAMPWPIPLDRAITSDKDKAHPRLADVVAFRPRPVAILGAGGQLANALRDGAPAGREVASLGVDELDLTDEAAVAAHDWSRYDAVLNAAAWTDVDGAERAENRAMAWALNAAAPARLARLSAQHGFTLVHVSSDYVFDGTSDPHGEDEPVSPLGVYGQSKAAGDLAVAVAPRHYLLRTSWLIGDGKNFVDTMAGLAERGVDPSVVSDQVGRPTFTRELAAAIWHLLDTGAPYGTYNATGAGEPASWADVARATFEFLGADPARVRDVTTEEYFRGKDGVAPRPLRSTLDLARLEATGFATRDWRDSLADHLRRRAH